MSLVGALVAGTLLAIAVLHLYWVGGGRWGAAAAVPEVAGRAAFSPSPLATGAVALALLTAAATVAMRAGLVRPLVPPSLLTIATWMLAAIFGLRTLGDFRLVGLFKRVRGTIFARRDTLFYSPLCLLLSLGCAYVAWH